ncbi:MAG TPA: 2Fe-2S iron-sulfur cluster-binding protein [Casimicrobiaceae bacterium]|nr:2Fe-2S iron-sulfur cluster-binding protein [Casimicrobiaceae bacterium]
MKFTFDGTPVEARQGETIAAALTRAGISALGRRRDGAPRGIFCGMGVCQECVVHVDGLPSRRACMEIVADGMATAAQNYAPSLPPASTVAAQPATVKPVQVLVVGAGAAGLAAAYAAALCGARVTVVDERAKPGGQYFKQRVGAESVDAQMREGRELIAKVAAAGVEFLADATVWGAFGPQELAATVAGAQCVFAPERLVLAAGAYERGVPLPGWTLPGYMTTGAAQTLLRAYGVVPGRRMVVGGNGPLNFQLAAELVRAGADIAAVVETSNPSSQLASLIDAARASPRLIAQGLGYVARLRRARVPIYYQSAVIAAHGTTHVESCTVARIDASGQPEMQTASKLVADAICGGYGFLPANEIARALGCRHDLDSEGRLATIVDFDGLTTLPGVYAIGDAAAFRGAQVARCQGFVTGCAVARSLGLAVPAPALRELGTARPQLAQHLSFQRALWRTFAAPVVRTQLARHDTIVCRCENVTYAEVEDAIGSSATTLGAIKRRTRAGMGRCQGRYCESIVASLLPQSAGAARDERFAFAPRAPIKPIRIKDLV